jgi:putative endonuclease
VYERLPLIMSDEHLALGKKGEEIAMKYLSDLGYAIVDTNVKTGRGEIDIIAMGKGMIVFVEVKTRSVDDAFVPSDRVNMEKIRRIEGAGEAWLDKQGLEVSARIDVIGVVDGVVVEHYKDITN